MLSLPVYHFLWLLPPVIQSSLHPRRLLCLDVWISSASLIRVPHLLVDVGVQVWRLVLLGNIPVSDGYLSRYLFSFHCFQMSTEIC